MLHAVHNIMKIILTVFHREQYMTIRLLHLISHFRTDRMLCYVITCLMGTIVLTLQILILLIISFGYWILVVACLLIRKAIVC